MKYLVVLLSLSLLAAGVSVGVMPAAPGDVVAYGEVDHAMGACGNQIIVATTVCYGGNCQGGGCGCVRINKIVNGQWKIADATPCATSQICTAPQSILNVVCFGTLIAG